MTQTVSRTQTKEIAAIRRVESYRKRFGDGHVYLACYAALPLALTPDLLYRLWANFQRDGQGELLEIPWIGVSDLLLSNLCEEVGEELYEMEDGVRAVLIQQLRSHPRLGEARLKAVAEFVLAYVEPQLNSPDLDMRDLAEVQQWRSLAYLEPKTAARAIAQRLTMLDHGDRSEWLRMARVVEPLAEPLVGFEPLVDYTWGMAAFVRGQREEAISQLQRALGEKQELEVVGVLLSLPQELRSLLQPERSRVEAQQSWVDFLLKNRRWVGAGIGLLVIVGSGVYWWQTSTVSVAPPLTKSCSTKPPESLEKKNVKQIEFSSQPIIESGQLTAGQPLGYSFDAKKSQKFHYLTTDEICIVVYTPANKILNDVDLPEDGTYTVQVFVSQGSTSFSLEMDLGFSRSLNKDQALLIVKRWLGSKQNVFAPPWDRTAIKRYTTGPLYSDITKSDGSLTWLKKYGAYYNFKSYKVNKVLEYSNSGQRPSIKLNLTEDRTLHTPQGEDPSESGIITETLTYFFELEDGIWKIYDYRKE
jgi:hypothetical protein